MTDFLLQFCNLRFVPNQRVKDFGDLFLELGKNTLKCFQKDRYDT